MKRNTINIDNYKYIVDLYKCGEDISSNTTAKFIMLKKFDVINTILQDTDIYFIEKNLFTRLCNEGKLKSGRISYPAFNSNIQEYSIDFTDFNPDLTDEYIFNDAYDLYQKSYDGGPEIADIRCDMVRVYHPRNKKHISALIHFDNYINGIHCHYFCQRYSDQNIGSETEFSIDQNLYSEFIEFIIPNVEDLFSKRIFYREDTTFVDSDRIPIQHEQGIEIDVLDEWGVNDETEETFGERYIFINSEKAEESELIFNTSRDTYSSMYFLTIPYIYKQSKWGDYYKFYLEDAIKGIKLNYITFPLNVTIYPYTEIGKDNRYLLDSELNSNKDTFITENKFSLSAKFGFDEGVPSIISTFQYPKQHGVIYVGDTNVSEIDDFENFRQAYEYFFNVNFDDYMESFAYNEELGEFIDYDEYVSICSAKGVTPLPKDIYEKQCAYEITIASDVNFTQIIYHKFIVDKNPDNFGFSIDNIFDSWYEIPDLVVAKTTFVDRYVGMSIPSNVVVLTKEKLKYSLWRDIYTPSNIIFPPVWKNLNQDLISEVTEDQVYNDKETHWIKLSDGGYLIYNKKTQQLIMDSNKFNFIDKITCVVRKENTEQNETKYSSKTPQVIYKPIFYRTTDLQNINIRSGLLQNIGVNLSDYMSKVDTFKLCIGNKEYTEYARNDIFVIFRINSNDMGVTTTNGTYNILNQDDEYISSGNWKLI